MRFAGDVRLPEMLFASARLAPPGGRLTDFAREAISKCPGVRHIAARDGWFAVVADNGGQPSRRSRPPNPNFTGNRSPARRAPLFEDALSRAMLDRWFGRGDYDKPSAARARSPRLTGPNRRFIWASSR